MNNTQTAPQYTRHTLALEIAFKTAADCARTYACATVERNVPYESPTLFSDLAYRDARAAAHLAHFIESQGFGFILRGRSREVWSLV